MTKADIIETVNENVEDISKKKAGELVEAVFDLMKQTLVEGEDVKIPRFGNFTVREKKERTGRNPQTGKAMTISSRRVVSFKVSTILRDEVNEG